MIDDDLYLDLPDDPADALPIFLSRLKEHYSPDDEEETTRRRRAYLTQLFAYLNYHQIDIVFDQQIPWDNNSFYQYFDLVEHEIELAAATFNLRRLDKIKKQIVPVYVLTAEQKDEIHKHIGRIRKIIAVAQISDTKREALSNKLNAFANEVDRDRTRLQALSAFLIAAKREVIDGVKEFEPVLAQVDKILDRIAEAKDWVDSIGGPPKRKELPSPSEKKQIEGPKSEKSSYESSQE